MVPLPAGWPRRRGRQRRRGQGHSCGRGFLGERGGEAPLLGGGGEGGGARPGAHLVFVFLFSVQVVGLAAKQSRIRNISNTVVKVKQILGRR